MSAERDALAELVVAWDSEAYHRSWGQRMTAAIAAARAALAAPAQGEPQPEDDFVIPCAIDGCKQPSLMPASEYCSLHSAIGTSPTGGEFAPQPAEPPAQAATDDLAVRAFNAAPNAANREFLLELAAGLQRQAREIAELRDERNVLSAGLQMAIDRANTWEGAYNKSESEHRRIYEAESEQLTRPYRNEIAQLNDRIDAKEDRAARMDALAEELQSRAECAEYERDALRECVKTADAMRRGEDCPMCDNGKLRNPAKLHWDSCAFANYDAARAKVQP